MIEKPTILVTSLGRTGTEFFARLFQATIADCTSIHEPDIVQFGAGDQHRTRKFLQRLQLAGPRRMLFLKALGKWTLANLSDDRVEGRITRDQAIVGLDAQRCGFVEGVPGSVYVEAHFGYYGLLDITPHVFRSHKVVFVVRDGRDWVTSGMNWGEFYRKRGLRRLLGHQWPSARNVRGDPYSAQWDAFSDFEKHCWAWATLNQYALASLKENPDARLFYFEKIYQGEQRYQYLDEIIRFVTDLPGVHLSKTASADGWLEKKIHASVTDFPRWQSWTPQQRACFDEICGPLMKQLGYDY